MKLLTFSAHKNQLSHSRRMGKIRKGFSIVEVAVAMGVVTLLLTTFLGIFGPAQKNVMRALGTKDANRMKDALAQEMSILRSSDSYTNSFEKAFRMIEDSHDETKAVLVYQYKAEPKDSDDDGILPAFTGQDGIQGRHYIIQTAVRALDSSVDIEDELKAVEGPVFAVRMTQLVKDTTNSTATKLVLTAWNQAGITDPDNPSASKTFTHPDLPKDAPYPKAVIAFRAEFFKLKSNKFGYIGSNNWDFNKMGNAITEVNMAVRR